MRIGHGFDAHRLVAGRPFIMGGVHVPSGVGPLGHSDADVLAHAICDALLGAAALGDLGAHFPESDERWRGADSLALMAECVAMLGRAGYAITNVDATIVVQTPKLASHLPAMRERLAEMLAIPLGDVSVKAKTSEGMGYTGDGSGIAAYAVALIEPLV